MSNAYLEGKKCQKCGSKITFDATETVAYCPVCVKDWEELQEEDKEEQG